MELTIKAAYEEILNSNEFCKWVNPELKPIKNPEFCNNHFMIQMDDFRTITDSVSVEIYNIRKEETVLVHCKIKEY